VDDFEDYNNNTPDRVFETWKDGFGYTGYHGNGTGSTVGHDIWSTDSPYYQGEIVETSIVNSGAQSMPIYYDNTATTKNFYEEPINLYYSEVERMWDTPQDWTSEDVSALTLWFRGHRPPVGSISYGAGRYTMTAAGTDIWNVPGPINQTFFHDEFHFAYKRLNGEAQITAKVEKVAYTHEWAKAGVMIRNKEFDSDTPDESSAHVMVVVTPAQGIAFQYRAERGGDSTSVQDANFSAPHWVRLTRSGNTFTAEHSGDNITWLPVGQAEESYVEIPTMNADTYIGLVLTAHDALATCEAVFSNVNVKLTGGATISPDGPFTALHQDVGIISNDADKLYVVLEDNAGKSKLVEHPEPNATQIYTWQDWNIDLQDFNSAGVDLTSIKKMTIGIGNKAAPSATGSGRLYIDDIRLHRSRCVPEMTKPAGDLNDDCIVNYLDLEIMTNNWLIRGGWSVTPTDPGNANLVAYYKFDGNFNDSSGNVNHGEPNGASIVSDSYRGQVASFDGVNDYVSLPIGSLISSLTNCTFTTWVNFSNAGGSWQRIFDFGSNTTVYMFLTPRMGTTGALRFAITTGGGGTAEMRADAANTLAIGWHHVTVTIDADSDTVKLYLDGLLVTENTSVTLTPSDLGNTTNNWLGRSQYTADAYFYGMLDEFRIYNRALSHNEVAYLADKGAFIQPVLPLLRPSDPDININLYNADEAIDLKDYAKLASMWLEELLWP
jgi:regulation of enolase protein 1 (concanavalin A-like superfamily)